VKLAILLDVIS